MNFNGKSNRCDPAARDISRLDSVIVFLGTLAADAQALHPEKIADTNTLIGSTCPLYARELWDDMAMLLQDYTPPHNRPNLRDVIP